MFCFHLILVFFKISYLFFNALYITQKCLAKPPWVFMPSAIYIFLQMVSSLFTMIREKTGIFSLPVFVKTSLPPITRYNFKKHWAVKRMLWSLVGHTLEVSVRFMKSFNSDTPFYFLSGLFSIAESGMLSSLLLC